MKYQIWMVLCSRFIKESFNSRDLDLWISCAQEQLPTPLNWKTQIAITEISYFVAWAANTSCYLVPSSYVWNLHPRGSQFKPSYGPWNLWSLIISNQPKFQTWLTVKTSKLRTFDFWGSLPSLSWIIIIYVKSNRYK